MQAEQPAAHMPSLRYPSPNARQDILGSGVTKEVFFVRENQFIELLVIISPSSCHSLLSLPSADTFVCAKDQAVEMTWGLNITPVCFLQQPTVSWIGTVEGMARQERKERNY